MTVAMATASTRASAVRLALSVLVLFTACIPGRGCSESQFLLDPGSRLPRWFTLPAGFQRNDVVVNLSYYAPLVGSARTATVTLRSRQGSTLSKVVATLRGREPLTLEPHAGTGAIPYPSYEVLTANGVSDVVEHRRLEPIFYMTDDAGVWRKLGVTK